MTITTTNLTLTDIHDSYENILSTIGIGSWKSWTRAKTL